MFIHKTFIPKRKKKKDWSEKEKRFWLEEQNFRKLKQFIVGLTIPCLGALETELFLLNLAASSGCRPFSQPLPSSVAVKSHDFFKTYR